MQEGEGRAQEEGGAGRQACLWFSLTLVLLLPAECAPPLGLIIHMSDVTMHPARSLLYLQKWLFLLDTQSWSPGKTVPGSPLFASTSLLLVTISWMPAIPPAPVRFALGHPPLSRQHCFCQPHLHLPSASLQVPSCLHSLQLHSPRGLCTCWSLCQDHSPPTPTCPPQVSLRLHGWEAILDALSRWGAVCVWVPCSMSSRTPCCDCPAPCSAFGV